MPHLIDNQDSTNITGVDPTELVVISPKIVILSKKITGKVRFTGASQATETEKQVILDIVESEFLLSLPEFGLIFMIGMILVSGIVYYFKTWLNF